MSDSCLSVKVLAPYACFTRPEFGAERVSYEVMTPSAARGVLEAIFWKPEFTWQVQEIHVLNPIQHFSILRNEINSWQSQNSAKSADYRYFADDDRCQRHTLGLRDVAYVIKAKMQLKGHAHAPPAKYRAQFRRRVNKGQCHHQPYLGTREFSAFFEEPSGDEASIDRSDELGLMLLDMEFIAGDGNAITYLTHDENGAQLTKGSAKPKFFRARLENGILRVPPSMILTKLKEYVDHQMQLAPSERDLELPPAMYNRRTVAWLISLTPNGELEDCICWKGDTKQTKKGRVISGPDTSRTAGVKPKLLVDTAEYVLGIGRSTTKPERLKECHKQFQDLIQKCAEETDEAVMKAIAAFYRSPDLDVAKAKFIELQADNQFDPGETLTFRVGNKIPANSDENFHQIEQFWARYTSGGTADGSDGPTMTCLVTGEETIVEQRLPFLVKGLYGGQPSGTALVSANAKPFTSYGLQNSLSSPISRDAAERFTKALNHLLASPKSRLSVGSTAYVFWSRDTTNSEILSFLESPEPQAVKNLMESPYSGQQVHGTEVDKFYGLALSASVARAVVRDWLETTITAVQENLKCWFRYQAVTDALGEKGRPLGVYALAASAFRDASEEMLPAVPIALVRTALSGTRLPNDLLAKVVRRNRAERMVTYPRAALIKLVLITQKGEKVMADMDNLNEQPNLTGKDLQAYHCGRLLAELEALQRAAIGRVNTSLSDRYYGAASSTPATAFPALMRNRQAHLSKLRKNRTGAFFAIDERIEIIVAELPTFPKTLNMQQQGLFSLGYYHQRAHQRAASKAAKVES